MELLTTGDYEEMRWSNGQGVTTQIAIHPKGANCAPVEFDWRLSMARVEARSDFSHFKNCRRWLTVLEGAGLQLNKTPLLRHQLLDFSGEEPIQASLLEGAVVDLGLIYRPDRVAVDVCWLKRELPRFNFLEGSHLIFCAEGSGVFGSLNVKAQETLRFEGAQEILWKGSAKLLAFRITSSP